MASLLICASWPFVSFVDNNLKVRIEADRVALHGAGFLAVSFAIAFSLRAIFSKIEFARVCLCTSVAAILFFSYLPIAGLIEGVDVLSTFSPVGLWAILFCVALLAAWRLSAALVFQKAFLLAALTMIAFPLSQACMTVLSSTRIPEKQRIPGIDEDNLKSFVRKPNVYFLVPDMYARKDKLREHVGFDNTSFLSQLNERGFFVAEKSNANYPLTWLSIPATLEMNYLFSGEGQDLIRNRRSFYEKLQGQNRTVNIFQKNGYRYVHFQNGYWQGSRCGEQTVDLCLGGGIPLSEVDIKLLQLTPIFELIRKPSQRLTNPRGLPELTRRLPWGRSPFFLFAHTIAPHEPFVVDRECKPIPFLDYEKVKGTQREQRLYREQLQCVNRRLLAFVDKVIARDPEAIIVIQGDHGTKFHAQFDHRTRLRDWTDSHVRERFAILNAIRLPKRCRDLLYATISPVNTFRVVFSCLQNHNIPLLPDEQFLATYEHRPDYGDVVRVHIEEE